MTLAAARPPVPLADAQAAAAGPGGAAAERRGRLAWGIEHGPGWRPAKRRPRIEPALRPPRFAGRRLDRLTRETGAPQAPVLPGPGGDRSRLRRGRGVARRDLARRTGR